MTAALASPVILFQAIALSVAGTLLALVAADRPAAGAAGALVAYAGAARLLEPLRAETDSRSRTHVLVPQSFGKVLLAHTVVPIVVIAISALLAAAGCAVAGALPDHGGGAALLAVLAAPTITLCAANSSRRGGRLPDSVLATAVSGDPSGGGAIVIAWIVAWPLGAAILGGGPAILLAHSGVSVLFVAALVALIVPPILALVVGREEPPG